MEMKTPLHKMTSAQLDATYTREVGGMAWHRTDESYIDAISEVRLRLNNEPCKQHKTPLSYVAQIEKNEAMSRRGMKQSQCPVCCRWYWNDEL